MALTVISPVYGTTPSSTTHAGNGGLSLSLASAPGQPYSSSNYGLMPSSALSSSSSGIASSGLGSPGGNLSVPPPPPPPPLTMTNTPTGRGLHHQPSMRVGITSPQPVGVYIFLMHTQALFLTLLSFCILYLFDRLVGSPLRRRDSIDNRNSLTLTPVLHYRGWGSGLGGRERNIPSCRRPSFFRFQAVCVTAVTQQLSSRRPKNGQPSLTHSLYVLNYSSLELRCEKELLRIVSVNG